MVSVAIVGGSGYTGGELIRLLFSHPEVEIVEFETEDIMAPSGLSYNNALSAWDSLWSSEGDW